MKVSAVPVEADVRSTALSADGTLLAIGLDNGVIQWMDVAKRKCLGTVSFPKKERVIALALAPDGKTLAAGGDANQAVEIWDLKTEKKPVTVDLSGKLSMAKELAFTPDGAVLATVGGGHEIYLWETKTYSNFATLKCPGTTACIAISPDGKKIAAGEDARKGRIWILDMPRPMEK